MEIVTDWEKSKARIKMKLTVPGNLIDGSDQWYSRDLQSEEKKNNYPTKMGWKDMQKWFS